MAEHRANAPTLPPAAPRHLRVPRARATQVQPTKSLQSNDWAGCDGVDRRPRRELACAHCCSFSFAAFCSHHLDRANDTMDSSTTIDSRRQLLL
jgi:hypothetical protein